MYDLKNIPSPDQAQEMLKRAEHSNPGGWAKHSGYVALAARLIAARHPDLDHETAYVLGLLHDIGRMDPQAGMRHILVGYRYLDNLGYADVARIALTHSFPVKDINTVYEGWDCPEKDVQYVEDYLRMVSYDDYDRLIQLCDALSLPDGHCLIEKRLVEAGLRHRLHEGLMLRWKAYLKLKDYFDERIGCNLYSILPGILENTFGFTDQWDVVHLRE